MAQHPRNWIIFQKVHDVTPLHPCNSSHPCVSSDSRCFCFLLTHLHFSNALSPGMLTNHLGVVVQGGWGIGNSLSFLISSLIESPLHDSR